jgi:hypothetical protein
MAAMPHSPRKSQAAIGSRSPSAATVTYLALTSLAPPPPPRTTGVARDAVELSSPLQLESLHTRACRLAALWSIVLQYLAPYLTVQWSCDFGRSCFTGVVEPWLFLEGADPTPQVRRRTRDTKRALDPGVLSDVDVALVSQQQSRRSGLGNFVTSAQSG